MSDRYIPWTEPEDSEVEKLFNAWNTQFLQRQKELDDEKDKHENS